MMEYCKRLIEVDLPIARISAHARREKSIRHGHISTLHIWWARRPLAACRAVTCAALWPDPADELCPQAFREAAVEHLMQFARRVFPERISPESRQLQNEKHLSDEGRRRWEGLLQAEKDGHPLDPGDSDHQHVLRAALLDFIADFANWDNSTESAYLETSRELTQAAHEALGGIPGTRPLVVDPFAGGGSIPLEALRVGADAFASDLNPVAVLLNKVALEYIPKYGQQLAEEIRKWGQWVKEQAEQELAEFYPNDPDGATPIAYLWARAMRCKGPGCGVEFPLIRSLWLAKGGRRSVAFRLNSDKQTKAISLDIDHEAPNGKHDGTVQRGSASCPICGFTHDAREMRKYGQAGEFKSVLTAKLVRTSSGTTEFRKPTELDQSAVLNAARTADARRRSVVNGLSVVPNEPVSTEPHSVNRLPMYGMRTWGDAFGDRQAVVLSTYVDIIRRVESSNELGEIKDALMACLALTAGKLADYFSTLCVWRTARSCVAHAFGRQALPFTWDYGEMYPFANSAGDWSEAISYLQLFIEHVSKTTQHPGTAALAPAQKTSLPEESCDVFLTDPPYYDAVSYADLSDYFYVWLRRILVDSQPQLFGESETNKDDEIIVEPKPAKGEPKTRLFYENNIMSAFSEGRAVCKANAIGVIVFAHRSTSGWESMLQSVVDAGWMITGSWPIDTERPGKVSGVGQARLMSSIHLVCRPRENADGSLRDLVGEWRDVLSELPQRLHEWMPRLASEGVVGADSIFACLGPALEIFSQYSRVEKASGEAVPLRDYLEHVWGAVSTEALSMIFEDADAAGLEPDARLTAMWLWTLGASANESNGNEGDDKVTASTGYTLEFDAARKIAQGLGIHLEQSESIVEVKGDKARMLAVAERTKHLFGKDDAETATARGRKKKVKQRSLFEELDNLEAEAEAGELRPQAGQTVLDRVHQSMILFASGRGEALRRFLVDDGGGTDARFWKLAQSLSALYPKGTDEKRWVDGVLARKKGLGL